LRPSILGTVRSRQPADRSTLEERVPYLPFEERRQRIIDAAVEVLAEEGLERLTTRRIAERADAPLGSLHYCFRNKDELVSLVAERGADMLQAAFADVDPERGVESCIRDGIDALWRWYQDNIGLQLALMELGLWRIRRGGDPQEVYAMWDPFGRTLLKELLERAVKVDDAPSTVPVDEIVRFILHRFDGLAYEYAASRDDKACGRQLEILADAMVHLATVEQRPRPPRRRKAASRR
jgi:AcrR family transcriptional regulator